MKPKILSLGEVLWDILPSGPVLGGALANFALHAQALGAHSELVSRIGNDPWGFEILERFTKRAFPTGLIAIDSNAETGTVSVELGKDGQPVYIIKENVAWDWITADPCAMDAASKADALCFGTLAQRSIPSRKAINELLHAARPEALKVFDINLRQHFYTREIIETSLKLANVLKLNDSELPILADLFSLSGETTSQLQTLAERFGLAALIYTRGSHGSLLIAGNEISEHMGLPTNVRDTVGAGDSFTATAVLGLLNQWPLERINQMANEVASFVCSQNGATPAIPQTLLNRLFTDNSSNLDVVA